NEERGVFRSTDGGATWQKVLFKDNKTGAVDIVFDPNNSNTLFASLWQVYRTPWSLDSGGPGSGLYKSTDGGTSWKRLEAHGLPAGIMGRIGVSVGSDSSRVYALVEAKEGGLFRSEDGGENWIKINDDGRRTWSTQYNQPTAQFYHVITDDRWPYFIYGAQQDNSTIAIKSYDDDGVIGRQDWFPVGGGESGYIAPYPPDPSITYAGAEGFISRFDKRTEQAVDISVWPLDVSGNGAENLLHRFNWTSPLFISPHDRNTLYSAAEMLFKSTNGGQSWAAISPDLTRNDKAKQKPSGGAITLDITSVEYYDTIFAVAESPLKKDLLWVGTDDGLVHVTTDGGQNWSKVSPKEMPEWSTISIVGASHYDPGTAYIAVDRHKQDDFRPLIYRTGDYGTSWTAIANGIPEGSYVRSVREDPKR